MMLVIEALDEAGSVDADFDAIVLIESSSEHVSGKGFVKVTKGVGLAPLNSCKSGPIELSLQDGGFTRMEPPEPLFVNFEGGPPAKVSLTPDLRPCRTARQSHVRGYAAVPQEAEASRDQRSWHRDQGRGTLPPQ
jgi:hypothetical protein